MAGSFSQALRAPAAAGSADPRGVWRYHQGVINKIYNVRQRQLYMQSAVAVLELVHVLWQVQMCPRAYERVPRVMSPLSCSALCRWQQRCRWVSGSQLNLLCMQSQHVQCLVQLAWQNAAVTSKTASVQTHKPQDPMDIVAYMPRML